METTATIYGNIELKNKVQDFIDGLKTEHTILSEYFDIEDIDIKNAFDSIYQLVRDNGGIDVEIIYYYKAIDFLKENDPSLNNSLELAQEFGYTLENLNSEVLASLLASQINEEQFQELETEITDFFKEIQEEIEESQQDIDEL